MSKYLNVGLTGGIACGKSLVASMFQALGCPVLDADKVYHSLILPGKPLLKKLAAQFGQAILQDDGALNRQALAEIIFADELARQKLDSLTHPQVQKEMKRLRKEIIKDLKRKKIEEAVLISDAALMVESGSYKSYDQLVVVTAEKETQVQRLVARNAITEEEALKRIESQMPIEQKASFADHVISNNGTAEELVNTVQEVHARLFDSMHK
jgi:dephospho-CoA kinase